MEGEIAVKIKTMDMKNYSLNVKENILVSHLKELIAKEFGPSVELQRLIFQGRVLRNNVSIEKYGVKNDCAIHMVVTACSPIRSRSMFGNSGNRREAEELEEGMDEIEIENDEGFDDRFGEESAWRQFQNIDDSLEYHGDDSFLSDASTILEIEIFSTVEDPDVSKNPLQSFVLIFVVNLCMLLGLHGFISISIGNLILIASSFACYMLIRSVTLHRMENLDNSLDNSVMDEEMDQ